MLRHHTSQGTSNSRSMIRMIKAFLVFDKDTYFDTSRDHRQRGGLRKSAARRGGATASRVSMTKRTEVLQQVHFDLRDSFGYFSIKKSDRRKKKGILMVEVPGLSIRYDQNR